ncbi:MAG: NAD-dependent epimerase/dehydratase family protein [Clostridiales bacterium]|nr:NAD-dependent epimerase/dehydratase family protein [Clostridiales bacterium]
MKKALIIGGAGFVGQHLARHLHDDLGWQTAVTKLPFENPHVPFAEVYDLDILNQEAVTGLLTEVKPDYIFHLAAQSSAALSWKKPAMTVDINIKGAVNVLEAIRTLENQPRVLLIGSSEEYGKVSEAECPITERQEARPGNIYAATKVCQEMIGKLYADAYQMDVMATRSFNHVGPGQAPIFVVADFCKQVAEVEAGTHEPVLRVGNLAAARDFTDVRDVVRAYALLAQKGQRGEIYNGGTGRAVTIASILQMILGQSTAAIRVEKDPERFRPLDAPLNVADISKLQKDTGWQPEIPLETTIGDALNEWRKAVS